MFRAAAGPFAAALRDGLDRGLAGLVWALVIAGLMTVGLMLLLAAALMGLSMLVGPLLACSILGLALVIVALLVAALRRRRPVAATVAATASPELSLFSLPTTPMGQLAFVVGFVAGKALLDRLGPKP